MPIRKGESIEIDGYRYDVLDFIDKGGLSTVFLAKEVATGETVVIKEFIYIQFYDPITRLNDCEEYWENEIVCTIAQSKSGYPCVKIIRYEKRPDLQTPEYYIVMSFIEGLTFLDFYRDFVKSCRGLEHLDIAGIVRNIFLQLAEHLQYCHSTEYIVHRDVSVKNIIVIKDKHEAYWPVLIDWGLAKYVGPEWIYYSPNPYMTEDMPQDIPIQQKGTPPELRNGYMPNATSDVYYLAHLMYFVFTGGIMREDAEIKSEKEYVLRPKELNWYIPDSFNEVVESMTQYEPADRPQSMNEVMKKLTELITINHVHYDFSFFMEQDTDEISGKLFSAKEDGKKKKD
jgi:serine/threonine protein kinase